MNQNRITAPPIGKPDSLDVFRAKEVKLNNGLSIYVINSGEDDVVKFEIIFPTGCNNAGTYSLASATHQLTDAGTAFKKSIDIAEGFDYYGAFFQSEAGPDFKSFTLHSISRFFGDVLPLLMEVIQEATFPHHEVENWKHRNIQKLAVNREKVSWQSRTEFNAHVFGMDHPYGFTPTEADYVKINTHDLQEFYKQGYPFQDALIIVSGKINDTELKVVEQTFNSLKLQKNNIPGVKEPALLLPQNQKIRIEKTGALQSGIRIGKQLFGKNHPDYLALSIANTVLGGYFGSRLMSNIREDKGYTYGIGSAMVPYLNSGSFFIATEAGSEVRDNTIYEIYKELQRLINEPVPEAELDLVKNYLWGAFQRSLDGPFALADRFKSIKLHGLDYDFFNKYFDLLNNLSPENIMEISAKHLQPDTMTEVIAG